MTTGSSTLRSAADPTLGGLSAGTASQSLHWIVEKEWRESGHVDLVASLQRHPGLLQARSLLLNLAVEEFRARRKISEISDLELHCARFREFGGSIERSILRQLETQRYVDDHLDISRLLSEPRWPKVGDDFGNFYVIEELGFGSIARVYLCLQRDVGNRHVVVKAAPYSDVEASILGRLSHPNITPIFSTGFVEEFNLHYLCMPFCGRSTLGDLLDVAFEQGCPRGDECVEVAATRWSQGDESPSQPLTRWLTRYWACGTYIDSVLALALKIADALDHAHGQRILHGDLKPSNVLLTPCGQPLLLDFNLSQDYDGSLWRCGGTLPYMPPEHLQLLGARTSQPRHSPFDTKSDVFSFGAVLYELFAGAPPVTVPEKINSSSEIADLLLDQLRTGIPSIRQKNPLVSRRLESVVLKCLAFDACDRPASIADVKQRLQTETRWAASLGRRMRVRPILFSAVLALPLFTISAVATYIAVQPPAHLAAFERGLDLASQGNVRQAMMHFNEAVEAEPSFEPARFHRGRLNLKIGEIDLAMNDFGRLANEGDPKSMAYFAYCFNLKEVPVGAIPWYERAIQSGVKSMPVYNNLGASYLVAQSNVTRKVQMARAESYLQRALELDSSCVTVRLNLIRLETAKSRIDPNYDPSRAWRYAQTVLASDPDGSTSRYHVYKWYDVVLDREASIDTSRSSNDDRSAEERTAHQVFEQLRQSMTSQYQQSPPKVESFDSANSPVFEARRYYLEPFLPDGVR